VIEARAGVPARRGGALVEFSVAGSDRDILVAVRACAGVRINALCTGTAVQARGGRALIQVGLADSTGVSSNADASVGISLHSIKLAGLLTGGAVDTWTRQTFVDINPAVPLAAELYLAGQRAELLQILASTLVDLQVGIAANARCRSHARAHVIREKA